MSRLETMSEEFRKKLIAKNDFTSNDEYNVSHKNAISDGDDHGKGENGGLIGSATDIAARNKMLVKNKFSANNPYDDATA
ncbi:MAG: hypothetical protein HC836_46400 [Richelia sp. RM2_1_2]|nr:hypothetical protein [Richelia sp. RM2_1_2]